MVPVIRQRARVWSWDFRINSVRRQTLFSSRPAARYKNNRDRRAKTGEGYVLDPATNSPLEVDREGNFYINVGIEENQEGFKESKEDREGNPLEGVATWL